MKAKTTMILCILVLIFFAFNTKNSKTGAEVTVSTSKYHIINAIDLSGTAIGKDWPCPDKQFFEKEIAFLERNGGGVLEVYNMSLSITTSVKLRIKPLVKVPDVYKGEKAVKDAKRTNERIQLENQRAEAIFWKKISKKVLNFKATSGNDYSYIEKHLKAIIRSLELPQYQTYTNITLLYTDFKNDVPHGKVHKASTELLEEISSLSDVSICNHSEGTLEVNATLLPNYEEFIGVLNSINNY